MVKIGDRVLTDYNHKIYKESADLKEVVVTGVYFQKNSRSGVCVTVSPALHSCTLDTKIDSTWFKTIERLCF